MITNIEEALAVVKESKFADAKITEMREGDFAEEHLFGFYVTDNQDYDGEGNDPFGYGLIVSQTGRIDYVYGIGGAILDALEPIE